MENQFDYGTYENALLTVPYGTKERYQEAEGWHKFKHIEEESESGIADNVAVSSRSIVCAYSIDGRPASVSNRCLNILRMSDGTVRKVMVK